MPHIRIRNLTEPEILRLSFDLPPELAQIMETSADNFTLELVDTKYFKGGHQMQADPYIEIHWFERSAKIKKQSADWFVQKVRLIKNQNVDVTVVFTAIEKSSYFENGDHF